MTLVKRGSSAMTRRGFLRGLTGAVGAAAFLGAGVARTTTVTLADARDAWLFKVGELRTFMGVDWGVSEGEAVITAIDRKSGTITFAGKL